MKIWLPLLAVFNLTASAQEYPAVSTAAPVIELEAAEILDPEPESFDFEPELEAPPVPVSTGTDIFPQAGRLHSPHEARHGGAAAPPGRPQVRGHVRGVHLTAWVAGSTRMRRRFLDRLQGTVINTVVIPVKESDGRVYVPGLAKAKEYGTARIAIPNPELLIADLRERGLRKIARIVVFKDNVLPGVKPDWAIKDEDGGLWRNDKGLAWVDPYRKEVWEYNIDLAIHAAELGFDEIQFDYIRFPSDGEISRCRYSEVQHSSRTMISAMNDFLRYAGQRLAPHDVEISVAVFGLTVSISDGLGIGQRIVDMIKLSDYLTPMMYPSHYQTGSYGLKNPNAEPYDVIRYGLRDAKQQVGTDAHKLRPFLQDFSLGVKYGPAQVLAQIRAAREHGVNDWILWNPVNRYNWEALRSSPPESTVHPPGEYLTPQGMP